MKIKVKKDSFKAVIKISDYEIGKLQLNKETLVELVGNICKAVGKDDAGDMEVMNDV